MSMLGLDAEVIRPLITALSGESDQPAVAERFARAAWSGIAEPGDRAAGLLVAALGAEAALGAVIDRWDVQRLQERADELTLDELSSALARWQPRINSASAVRALTQAERFQARLVVPGDAAWPSGFADLGEHAPLALWVRGDLSALAALEASIALVGARAATGYGEHVTMEASAGLVDRGYAIVSGAAYGIDGMAHRAALASSGTTIAFLAGGADRLYPSGHEALLSRIMETGAVVSELPCGAPPTKWRFLQRNRLIAAASSATVVIEAGWRSGSLNTAGHAASIGRPLGAVPGPVTSATSAGCHRLIREHGAVLVSTVDEIAELVPLATTAVRGGTERQPSDQIRVLDAMSARAPRAVGDLAARAGLSVAEVQAVLGTLQLEGAVAEKERGWLRGPH
ncbi:DNA-processing protein DprA [soil metagenome]